jgi:hypothetical protein
MRSSRCGKEKGEDGMNDDLSQSATQLREQSPMGLCRNVGEDMRLVKREDDEGPPSPLARFQHAMFIDKSTKFFSCLFNTVPSLTIRESVSVRVLLVWLLSYITVPCKLERSIGLRNGQARTQKFTLDAIVVTSV